MTGVWDGCAPPPARVSTERDIAPSRNTVPRADGHYIVSYSDEEGLTERPAEQADLKHCASCTCPPEDPSYSPVEGRPVQGCMVCATYRAEGRACPDHRAIPPGQERS